MLLREIQSRKIDIGDRIWSEPALSRTLNVSRSTVRHAIKNLVKHGVLESQPGFGHVVRSRQPRFAIGVVYCQSSFLPQIAPFHNVVLRSIHEQLRARQARCLLYLTLDGELDVAKLQSDIKRHRIHALVGKGWPRIDTAPRRHRLEDQRLLASLEREAIPFVEIGERKAPHSVRADHEAIAYEPSRLLLRSGVRDLALVTARRPQFHHGFLRAMSEAGLALPINESCSNRHVCWIDEYLEKSAYEQFLAWWDQGNRPQALILTDDVQAKGVVTALMHRNIRVPQDLRLASLTIQGSELFYPLPMIRLELDPAEFAARAIDQVFAAIQGEPDPSFAGVIAPKLIVPPGYLPALAEVR